MCVKCTWIWLGRRLKIFSAVEQRMVQQWLGGFGRAIAWARPCSTEQHRDSRWGRRSSWNCCKPTLSTYTWSLSSATCFIHRPRVSYRWARVWSCRESAGKDPYGQSQGLTNNSFTFHHKTNYGWNCHKTQEAMCVPLRNVRPLKYLLDYLIDFNLDLNRLLNRF